MQLFRDSVLSVVLWVIVTGSVAAGPYRELIVFGDTLSDVGNASLRTLGLQPGPYYFSGRFTNGPVYSELLSLELGLGAMTPSSAGGGNFAFGGAQTSGTGGVAGFVIHDIDELETSQPNLNLFRLDVSAVIDEVVADPSAFGFVNITDPAAPGLEPGASSYDTSLIASNPNGYLFWDQIHPSAAAHTILAKRAFAAVPEPASQLPIAVAMLALAASHRPSRQKSDGLPNPS